MIRRLALTALLAAILPAGVAEARGPLLGARLRPTTQRTLQNRRTVRVRVTVARPVRLRFQLFEARGRHPLALSSVRTGRIRRAGTRDVVIGLTPAGRRAVLGCRPPHALKVRVRAPGQRTATSTARLKRDMPHACLPTPYRVGIAVRTINPSRDGTYGHKPVYLGGYGIGSPPLPTGRPATGILGPGIDTRAIVISAGKKSIALADIQVQGWFVANKDGPLGFVDMRHRIAQLTHGALPPQQVVIQSDHTHGGPDPIGVWGGVPIAYRRYMFNRTVDAIVAAWRAQRPAGLYYGTAPGRDLLSNQFAYDSAHGNDTLDSDVRLLQARDRDGANLVTLLNFSAHSTVLGSSNTKVTGDWESAANPLLEKRFGGRALTIVGTLGRTQPADRGCHDKTAKGDRQSLCAEADYANRVIKQVVHAAHTAKPLGGHAVVDGRSYLIQDAAHNVAILGFDYVGDPAGIPLNRAILPPWLAGNVLGTATGTLRIGDVLMSVIPGEAYPQIPLGVRSLVPGMRGYMTAGLAGDQLGYLIAPYEAYPEPIRSTFLDRGDQPSPLDNDNYAFNVSHTIGSRIECSLLRGAGDVLGKGMQYRDAKSDCGIFANDLAFPAGADANGG